MGVGLGAAPRTGFPLHWVTREQWRQVILSKACYDCSVLKDVECILSFLRYRTSWHYSASLRKCYFALRLTWVEYLGWIQGYKLNAQ